LERKGRKNIRTIEKFGAFRRNKTAYLFLSLQRKRARIFSTVLTECFGIMLQKKQFNKTGLNKRSLALSSRPNALGENIHLPLSTDTFSSFQIRKYRLVQVPYGDFVGYKVLFLFAPCVMRIAALFA